MRFGRFIDTLFKGAILCGCVYGVVHWQQSDSLGDDAAEFAERACIDEANARYDVSRVKVYDINKNPNGYIVRVSAILSRGAPAKVVCRTYANGSVREIMIDER